MASISSLTGSSSSSSIYGNRNVITGLASGLDTETLIENSIQGYKLKVQNLIAKQTKLTWKQDAYRSISDKLIALSQKYTSYTSKTNLSSPSYFTRSVLTTTNGKYADKVSATGKTSSDIKINSVEQLATAARYSVSAADTNLGLDIGSLTGDKIDWTQKVEVSDITGSMSLKYGSRTFDLTFTEADEKVKDAAGLADLIRSKLSEQNMALSNGDTVKASERIGVSVGADGTISFTDKSGAGNSVYINSVSGALGKNEGLDIKTGAPKDGERNGSEFKVKSGAQLSHTSSLAEYLSDKTIDVTLDGTTKKISLGKLDESKSGDELMKQLVDNLNTELKSAFKGKVSVAATADGGLAFSTTSQGSTLKAGGGDLGKVLGLGETGATNYLDTSRTLKELLGEDKLGELGPKTHILGSGRITSKKDEDGNVTYYDQSGNRVKGGDGDDKYYRLDDDGNEMMGYRLVINDTEVGVFDEDTALESVMLAINNSEAGVSANYSQLTGKFTFTANETGAGGRIDFGEGLAQKLFGGNELNMTSGLLTDDEGNAIAAGVVEETGETYYLRYSSKTGKYYRTNADGFAGSSPVEITDQDIISQVKEKARKGYTMGQDAIVNVTVNGENLTLTRSSNTINMDGLSVTLKGTFNNGEGEDGTDIVVRNGAGEIDQAATAANAKKLSGDQQVTFTTKADADKLVETIKGFVEEYNAVMKEVHDGFATQPLEKSSSSHTKYEPLTDEDKEGMSDSAIEAYEEKAKTGLLFGDSDLSQLYNRLRSVITPTGDDRKAMEAIGLSTSYEDGITSLTLDEDKLRAALDSNPDMVKDVFTKSREYGASSDGLMASLKKPLDTYASTSSANYGILLRKAGNKAGPLSLMNNTIQKQMEDLDDQIDRWQDKMSNQIDYYTKQFTKLEQLMAQMNSQSSALSGLMMGG